MTEGYVLLNIAHHERRPSAPRASFRLLGVFANLADVHTHVNNLLTVDVDMHVAPVGKFFALMRRAEQDEAAHVYRVRELYSQRLKSHEAEFRENVACQKTGAVSSVAEPLSVAPDTDAAATAAPAALHPAAMPAAVPRAAELRLQNFAVVSVIPDYSDSRLDYQQPGVVVWGVYDTEEQAKAAVKTKHAIEVTDLHLEITQLYEWLCPTEVDKNLDEVPEEYRDPQLTALIQHRKDEKRQVKAYRASCGDREPPLIDVSGPQVRTSGAETCGDLTMLA